VIYTIYVLLSEYVDFYYTAIIGNLIMFGVSSLAAVALPRRPDAPALTNLTVWTMERSSSGSAAPG
jgi:hypothetical protein